MYLMISTYLSPLDVIDQARPAHLAWLETVEAKGIVVTAGRQDPPVGGVVLLDVASREEAVALMAEDPYVLQGLARYEPTGWVPTRGVLARPSA